MPEKFDIYSKIFYRDVEKFVRHLCLLVLRHQMRVSNYFVNSFYSAGINDTGGNSPPVSTTPAANLPPVDVNGTSGKYWEQYQAAETLK
jgi:hypothetical protein